MIADIVSMVTLCPGFEAGGRVDIGDAERVEVIHDPACRLKAERTIELQTIGSDRDATPRQDLLRHRLEVAGRQESMVSRRAIPRAIDQSIPLTNRKSRAALLAVTSWRLYNPAQITSVEDSDALLHLDGRVSDERGGF